MRTRLPTLMLIVVGAVSAAAQAVDASDEFPPTLTHRGDELERKGYGNAYYLRFIKVYQAALYGPAEVAAERVLARDAPACLRIRYHRAVTAGNLVQAANVVLQRQHSAAALAPIEERIERLHAAYRDVQAGDRYALCYQPAAGTVLSLNDERLARIQGHDFARAYLGIWLGEDPLSDDLKQALIK